MKQAATRPLAHTVDGVAQTTGHSRSVVYDAIRVGDLRSYLVGKRRFVRDEDVRKWLTFLQRESDAGRPVMYRSRKSERKAA